MKRNWDAVSISLHRLTSALTIASISLLLQSCTTPKRNAAVPTELEDAARIPGMPVVRYWADEASPELQRDAVDAVEREQRFLQNNGHTGPLPPAVFLAISGGGDNGAFGAGLLKGWTKSGSRPEFKVVTGISTGALIAPFAFLGPKYDAQLVHLYTNITPDDIRKKRNIISALFKDAVADNRPLYDLLKANITPQMLAEIAVEHRKGRILLIGTTDLDAQRGVVWNIGKIAASGNPKALHLVHQILLASAAIPGVFPPTFVNVEANGKPYQEMHVDGGATAQAFLYPPSFELNTQARETAAASRKRKLYIIRNARLDPNWAEVSPRTLSIMGRAIGSLIQTQGVGDLYNMYLSTKRDGIEYNLASIPSSFNAPHKEEFDTEYMRKLCDVGYTMAAKGYEWAKFPPGYTESEEEHGAGPAIGVPR